MTPLVSVIIPCYNAEAWVVEAIESALGQTWRNKEVIVINDGSNDASLRIINSFDGRIRWETGPNRGGCAARNRGLELARGELIQFLDADDYLLPSKIARQMSAFTDDTDVLYEDWQRLEEMRDGTSILHPTECSGPQQDVLEALLGSWAPPPCAFLFRRKAVDDVGRWNEAVPAAQDWELHLRLAMAGARYKYLPGCFSVYRRPATPTVSTKNREVMNSTVTRVLREVEHALHASGKLNERYKCALALSYFSIARCYWATNRPKFWRLYARAKELSPDFLQRESRLYRAIATAAGITAAERLAHLKRRLHVTGGRCAS